MPENTKDGPACSLDSRPREFDPSLPAIRSVNICEATDLIESQKPVVIILDAAWCADCRNQMQNLPYFEKALNSAGITVNIFTAEGMVYDQFISPEHKEFAMRLNKTPIGSKVLTDSSAEAIDSTSVIGKRGREGYPAIFYISEGSVSLWSIEDVSIKQLDVLAKKILNTANT